MESVNWMTLYITGKGEFKAEVVKRLEGSDLDIMPGYMDTVVGGTEYDFYWISEKTSLRQVKEAIGSKTVFKYRLRFFTSLEEFSPAIDAGSAADFSSEEIKLINDMRRAG